VKHKLKLIEYDDDIYAGDSMDPDIQYRDIVSGVSGTKKVTDDTLQQTDILEIERQIEDMRAYAKVISSSSSSSSSSETPQEELFEHHETGGDTSYTIGQTSVAEKLAQTFTPDIAHEISKVELELFDNQGDGITGDIDVAIKATSGGLPTGDALATGTIDAADLEPAHDSDVYNNVSISLELGEYTAGDIHFSPDGYNLFVIVSSTLLYRYTLSTAWNITTASYSSSLNITNLTFTTYHRGITFNPTGTLMYVVGFEPTMGCWVFKFSLSSAWNITTASLSGLGKQIFASAAFGEPQALFFSSDGKKLYHAVNYNDAVFQYAIPTAWDTETMVANSLDASTSVSAYDTDPRGVCFTSDGKVMYVMGAANDEILKYNCSTAWSLSSDTKDSYEMDVTDATSSPRGIFCKDDGKTIFVVSSTGTLYEFNMPEVRGDWHECELTGQAELSAATQYAIVVTYDDYEEGVSEPEWVTNEDGDDNYSAGSLLRYSGSAWFDS